MTRTMKREMNAQEAFTRLAALCARSEHCRHDMLEKMRQWTLDEADQAKVMEQLVAGRYVDDERYARAFAADKLRYAKWGRRKIEQALRLKHIGDDIAGDVLGEISDDEYLEVLRPLVRQKLRSTRAASDYELRMKVTRYALSRGFTMDLICRCLDTAGIDGDGYDD